MPANGSSPLARGTPRRGARGRCRLRFIPARAGNTAPRPTCRAPSPVHPRSRGEHVQHLGVRLRQGGSSPLARGTRSGRMRRQLQRRFIPARAGNTATSCRRATHRPVHPRSRGEHIADRLCIPILDGSSPLARGTRSATPDAWDRERFIPARAGNTGHPRASPRRAPVHPRSRGEHTSTVTENRNCSGSSPLARGTRSRRPVLGTRERFIPARAGNTPYAGRSASCLPVHPRSRGEHGPPSPRGPSVAGSSPLARGTPMIRGYC